MSKWLAAAAAVVVVTGCNFGQRAFICQEDGQCLGVGPGAKCELAQGGVCSFSDSTCPSGQRFGDRSGGESGQCVGGEQKIDAGIDTPTDTPVDMPGIDARTCFGTGLLQICLAAAPSAPLTISSLTTIDTSNAQMCAVTSMGGTGYCVIAATTITVDAKLRATGMKPLVLIASDSITVRATIDVGSHRGETPETGAGADPTDCMAGTLPGNGNGGGGGGAGGSFLGLGGAGGTGPNGGNGGVPGAVAGAITKLRGGCPGQDGQGGATEKGIRGHGGGAVWLIAVNQINLMGSGVNAAGEGGTGAQTSSSGGGGGGAGGMIGFDAPMIMGNGLILASGGGGGEGSGTGTPGNSGADPSTTTPAAGGNGNTGNGGDGGDGSSNTATGPGAPGMAGVATLGGGGGGGGGAGLVKAPATANLGTLISPPATP